MKATELIKELQKAIEEYGDLEVEGAVECDGYGHEGMVRKVELDSWRARYDNGEAYIEIISVE